MGIPKAYKTELLQRKIAECHRIQEMGLRVLPDAFEKTFRVKSSLRFDAELTLKLAVICNAQKSAATENQGRRFPNMLWPLKSLVISTVPAASHTGAQRRKDRGGTSMKFPEKHTKGRGKEKERKKEKKKKDFKLLLPAPEQMAFSHPSHPFDGK